MKAREKAAWKPSRGGPWPVVQLGGELAPGEREWLHTNGAGAYAMSTVPLMHTRRHHGAFVAMLEPPLGRHVIVSHGDTSVLIEDDRRTYRISTHQFPNVAPTLGYRLLEYFALDPIPRWTYRLGSHTLERTLCLARGRNEAVWSYTWYGRAPAKISIRPLMPLRPVEQLMNEHGGMMQVVTLRPAAVELRPVPALPSVYFAHEGMFMGSPDWWRKFEYLEDRADGLAFQEDMWTPGVFELALEPGKTSYLSISVGAPLHAAPAEIVQEASEFLRRQDLGPKRSNAVRVLAVAAEQFLLDAREPPAIAAGYPSHDLFVRDSILALPGLLIAREQFERAERVLGALLRHQRGGLLPAVVPVRGVRRSHALPDATLWLFETARLLLARRGPRDPFIANTLFPALVRAFLRCVSRQKKLVWCAADGLLVTAHRSLALTWMDAQLGGKPITQRAGIAVEHQALFTRGSDLLATLASFYGHDALAARANEVANRARHAFRARFWNSETDYPYDCVSEARDHADAWADASVRPNALTALAVDPTLFEDWQAETILRRVQSELLTEQGVRSLSSQDKRYIGHFGGNTAEREVAYHQGTAWTHLLGHYARAAHQRWGDEPAGRDELVRLLEHVVDSGPLFGQLPQLSDGDEPFRARACPAQATAVGEILRALVELGG
jgi:predicted glycogen debranching enzyme